MKDTLLFVEDFIGAVAVGKIAKGTKLGAKAAEMIQLAKNSTKARVLTNVEKWDY
ncbi:Uncharacterised protein [Gemella haemolysans]|nr:Uncharacterised protein [Gemella haemolysans]